MSQGILAIRFSSFKICLYFLMICHLLGRCCSLCLCDCSLARLLSYVIVFSCDCVVVRGSFVCNIFSFLCCHKTARLCCCICFLTNYAVTIKMFLCVCAIVFLCRVSCQRVLLYCCIAFLCCYYLCCVASLTSA